MTGLGIKAREAVFWTSAFNLFRDVLQLGQTLVLVRLLAPEAYGHFGLVTNVVGFFTVLSFREFLVHTLQVRDDRDVHYQDQFTAGAAIQAAMCVLMNATALILRRTDTYAPVAPMLHVMSALFILDLPNEFRVKMLERRLEWKRLRLLNAIGMVVYAVSAIALALAGAGAYALLVPTLLVPLPVVYDLFVTERFRPTWQFSWANFAAARRFGVTRMASASFVTGAQLLESAVLARTVGFVALGFFGRAIGLAQLSCQKVGSVLTLSLYPVLARIAPRSDGYRKVAGLMLRTVAWVVVPLATIVAILGRAVVAVLYGSTWLSVVPLVPWALAMGAVLAMAQMAYFVLLAHQQQRRCLAIDILRLVGTVAGLLVLLRHGLVAYLQALTLVHAAAFSLTAHWLYRDRAMTIGGLVSAVVPPIVASLTSLVCCEALRRTTGLDVRTFAPAFAYGVLFALVYVVSLRILFAALLRELVGYLPRGDRLNALLRFDRPTPAATEVA